MTERPCWACTFSKHDHCELVDFDPVYSNEDDPYCCCDVSEKQMREGF